MQPSTVPATLRHYTLLADGERGAIVGPRGDVAFLCAPRWHDDAVFSTLLGGRGTYVVRPADERFVWGGSYEDDTLIWRRRFIVGSDIVEVREALSYPGDRQRLVLLRRVEAVEGDADMSVLLDCRAGFGAEPMALRPAGHDVWLGRTGGLRLRWTGAPVGAVQSTDEGALTLRLHVGAGETHDLVLEISRAPIRDDALASGSAWRDTERAWKQAPRPTSGSVAPRDVAHSLAVLRGLTSGTGAMVAAATACLPERAEEGRDYDYRYAWVRDQCYAGHAAAAAGVPDLVADAAAFVGGRLLSDGAALTPAYTVDGDDVPEQRSLPLPGYPGAPDVATGNRVRGQLQLDAFGEALVLLASADRLDVLDSDGWRAAEAAVDAIREHGGKPDAGIWELDARRWAHSRLACVAGLRAVAARRPRRDPEWTQLAAAILADVERDCLHPSGRWQRADDDEAVDAALLLAALRGAVPARHSVSVATRKAVADDLGFDGYLYRFRHDSGPRHRAEGAFLLSGFHMAMAAHQQGDRYAAIRWFERNRGALGPPGLFTEEYDVVQRQLRGNLPQAFVHAAFIEAAHMLATDVHGKAEDEGA